MTPKNLLATVGVHYHTKFGCLNAQLGKIYQLRPEPWSDNPLKLLLFALPQAKFHSHTTNNVTMHRGYAEMMTDIWTSIHLEGGFSLIFCKN